MSAIGRKTTTTISWVFYPTKASAWWKLTSSLVKTLMRYIWLYAHLQIRKTKWTFRSNNRAEMVIQWTNDEKKKKNCLSFRLHRWCESGLGYQQNLVRQRKLSFQNQHRQSVKEETACTSDAREYDEYYQRAVRSGNATKWTRAKITGQLQLNLGLPLQSGAKIPKRPKY